MSQDKQVFWDNLHELTTIDQAVDVPASATAAALSIFQTVERKKTSNIFMLVPSAVGMVRRAGSVGKFFYELGDEYIVQLEISTQGRGIHMSGFASGFEYGTVQLHGEEFHLDTKLEDGNFQFQDIPEGNYSLSFSVAGEDYWVTGLELGQQP